MKYQNVWDKTLNVDEKVKYEFSIGDRYRKFGLIMWTIISIPLLFVEGFGVLIFLIALFYYGFYLKVANAYAFTDKRVLIHKGWLSTSTISVEYSQITDVSVQEPFFDRILTHTGNLAINTAGTNVREVVLKHIETPYETRKKLDTFKG